MGLMERGVNTANQLFQHGVAPIIGIKGGSGWQVSENPLGSGGPSTFPFHGVGKAFRRGGFAGAAGRLGGWLGVGFDPGSLTSGYSGFRSAVKQMPYFYRTAGGYDVLSGVRRLSHAQQRGIGLGAEAMGRAMAPVQEFAGKMRSMYRWRRGFAVAAGAAGVMGLGATVGYGNAMKLGAGWIGGAVLGGPTGAAIAEGGAAAGRRWGGRVGVAAAGIGLLTGLI